MVSVPLPTTIEFGALDAKRFDVDAAAGLVHFAEQHRPGLGREILKTAQHRVDIALERRGEQGMEARRHRRRELPRGLDHRIIARRALHDAAVDVGAIGLENHAAARSGDAIEPRLVEAHGNAFRVRRQPDKVQLCARPVGDEDWRLAGVGKRDRAGNLAMQQSGAINRGRESDVGGREVERRPIVPKCRRGLIAAADNAERKSADALRTAGIDPPQRGFAVDPAGQRAVGDGGGVIPAPGPADGEHDDKDE